MKIKFLRWPFRVTSFHEPTRSNGLWSRQQVGVEPISLASGIANNQKMSLYSSWMLKILILRECVCVPHLLTHRWVQLEHLRMSTSYVPSRSAELPCSKALKTMKEYIKWTKKERDTNPIENPSTVFFYSTLLHQDFLFPPVRHPMEPATDCLSKKSHHRMEEIREPREANLKSPKLQEKKKKLDTFSKNKRPLQSSTRGWPGPNVGAGQKLRLDKFWFR